MSLARAASAFIERRPNATTVAAAMARGAAGDACAQRAADHGTWDARRCATFMMWSTGVAFALDRYVYSHLFALWCRLCGNQIYGTFVLNRRVDLHAIDATPARWRGDAGSSPLDGARTAAPSP